MQQKNCTHTQSVFLVYRYIDLLMGLFGSEYKVATVCLQLRSTTAND